MWCNLPSCRTYAWPGSRQLASRLPPAPNQHRSPSSCSVLTWLRAHSRTDTMRSWSGWNTCPTLPMGLGSVVAVGKWPSGSKLGERGAGAGAEVGAGGGEVCEAEMGRCGWLR